MLFDRMPYRSIGLAWATAGAILVAPFPAFAYHDTIGHGASIGGFLPIVVVVALDMVGLAIWDRKRRKTKSKRKHKRR